MTAPYVCILPSIHEPWTEACLETCKIRVRVIDNTQHNIGSVKSWNLGIDQMIQENAQWLVVLSAAIRFGPAGGLDFIQALDLPGRLVVEASPVFGWHLIAFHRDLIATVGRFDENFFPYGYDDIDYSYRIQQGYDFEMNKDQWPFWWAKVPIQVEDAGMAHSLKLTNRVVGDMAAPLAYYTQKWGGPKGEERWRRPFGDPSNSIRYWPEVK